MVIGLEIFFDSVFSLKVVWLRVQEGVGGGNKIHKIDVKKGLFSLGPWYTRLGRGARDWGERLTTLVILCSPGRGSLCWALLDFAGHASSSPKAWPTLSLFRLPPPPKGPLLTIYSLTLSSYSLL